MTGSDKCYATKGCASIFNTDKKERQILDPVEVRDAFDFDIVKKPSFDESGRPIPGHYHLVREDTNEFIPSAGIGEKFVPVQHLSVYDYILNEIMPKVPNMSLETVGTIHGGGTGLIVANFGGEYRVDGDDSPNSIRLMFSNPCNGYGSLILGFTNVRLWCQNQIPAAIRQAKQDGFQIRHTKFANQYVANALKVIFECLKDAQDIQRKSAAMAKVNINRSFIRSVLEKVYPSKYEEGTPGYKRNEKRIGEVLEQFEMGETAQTIKGDTAWKLFNSITYPIYNPKSLGSRMDVAEIAYDGAIGQRGKKVNRIFNTIYAEALRIAA